MAVEIVIGIAALALLGGAGVGYWLGKGKDNSTRVRELEQALETSQTELADYRSQVYGQFAETAEKFRALDKSYNDLHRQLAESSVALCGDEGTPLLAGPSQSLLSEAEQAEREEIEINPAPSEEQINEVSADAGEVEAAADTSADDVAAPAETAVEQPSSAEKEVTQDNIVVGEPTDVPVLTDVQKGADSDSEVQQDEQEGSDQDQKLGAGNRL